MSMPDRGKLGAATDPDQVSGVHLMRDGEAYSMSMPDRGKLGAVKSIATDPGMSPGAHYSEKEGRVTTSMRERGQLWAQRSNATDPSMSPGAHYSEKKGRVTTSMRERSRAGNAANTKEMRRDARMKMPMHGAAYLNTNAERDFNANCASIKTIFEEVNLFGCQCCIQID